jgi:FkbM family methyltransferase
LSNVTPVQVALSDRDGELVLHALRDRSNLATLEVEPGDEDTEPVTVPIERGDELLARLNAIDVDFIKIDVEGHEREVLAGLAGTIATWRSVLTIERVAKTSGARRGDAGPCALWHAHVSFLAPLQDSAFP